VYVQEEKEVPLSAKPISLSRQRLKRLIQHDTFLKAVAITYKGTVQTVVNGPFLIARAHGANGFSIPGAHDLLMESARIRTIVLLQRESGFLS
jgi:hypothetical protein